MMFIWKSTWEQMRGSERLYLEQIDKLKVERDLYKRELESMRDRVQKVLGPETPHFWVVEKP